MPRRRRGAAAAAIDAYIERGLLLRILLHSPKDVVAGLLAFAAVSAIIANALFLQAGPHPAPMFAASRLVGSPASVSMLPRPRPAEADLTASESRLAEPKFAEPRSSEPRTLEPRTLEPRTLEPRTLDAKNPDAKNPDPLANLMRATPSPGPVSTPAVVRPPAPIPPPPRTETTQSTGSRRVAAVQRALTEYGYGQLKPSGTIGPDTQTAIQKFERERKMPITGQVSDRLVRELSVVIGHSVD
jgi:Putative peptidoglycan binding domain